MAGDDNNYSMGTRAPHTGCSLCETGRRSGMDKLGVQTDQDKTKTASSEKACPSCGSELVADSNVPQCPKCGTKPFENEKAEAKKKAFGEMYGKKGE